MYVDFFGSNLTMVVSMALKKEDIETSRDKMIRLRKGCISTGLNWWNIFVLRLVLVYIDELMF